VGAVGHAAIGRRGLGGSRVWWLARWQWPGRLRSRWLLGYWLAWLCFSCRRENHLGQLPFLQEALTFGTNCQPEILRHGGLIELETPRPRITPAEFYLTCGYVDP
jgi:hypothetical protein